MPSTAMCVLYLKIYQRDIRLTNLLIFRGKEPLLGGSDAENYDVIRF